MQVSENFLPKYQKKSSKKKKLHNYACNSKVRNEDFS